jgi:hypothetical protein
MKRPRPGEVETAKAGHQHPQAEVGVLAVEEVVLVEAARPFCRLAAVDRGGRGRDRDLALGLVLPRVALVEPVRREAPAGVVVLADLLDHVAVGVTEDLARDKADPGIAVEDADERLEPARIELDVVVDEGDVLARARGDAGVDGRREAGVVLVRDDPHVGPVALDVGDRFVARGVVDDDDVEVAEALLLERGEHQIENDEAVARGGPIEVRDHH